MNACNVTAVGKSDEKDKFAVDNPRTSLILSTYRSLMGSKGRTYKTKTRSNIKTHIKTRSNDTHKLNLTYRISKNSKRIKN